MQRKSNGFKGHALQQAQEGEQQQQLKGSRYWRVKQWLISKSWQTTGQTIKSGWAHSKTCLKIPCQVYFNQWRGLRERDYTRGEYEAETGLWDWEQVNRSLMIILKEKTTGEARKRVLAAESGGGPLKDSGHTGTFVTGLSQCRGWDP